MSYLICTHSMTSSSTNYVGTEDLQEVLEMLEPVNERWQELGLALGLFKSTLNKIRADHHHSVNECKMEMLTCWLNWVDNCESTCNWQSLAEALRKPTVNHKPIADAIERKYKLN